MNIIDISPVIDEASPIFPGDEPYQRQEVLSFKKGDHLALSWIKSTVHIGAHADAPSHYHAEGVGIDSRGLEPYLGPCQVLDLTHVGPRRILLEDLPLVEKWSPRVLLQTKSFPHRAAFQKEFASLSPELIAELAAQGVRLVGIDTPSIDPADSKELESHQAIFRHDLAVLEGLDLGEVKPGVYQLIALPLKLGGADASPVRAVLLDKQ